MSSASNRKPQEPPVAAVAPEAPRPATVVAASPRFPRVNAAIDSSIGALSLIGFGFLKPIVAICRGEDPRAHMRQLWLDLGAPVLSIVAFLLIWSQVSAGIQTSLGQIPGPKAVWEQTEALWADHLVQRAKARAFYERQEIRNAERLAEDPAADMTIRKYTGMHDSLLSGRSFRTLNVLDDFHREALWIDVDTALPAERVVRVLDMLADWRGYPHRLRIDNGPEFIAHKLAEWAETHHVQLGHIQPGKPAQNAYIERFNRTFRTEVLDAYAFSSLQEVRDIAELWLEEYNAVRPHQALGGLTPYAYAAATPNF